MIWRKSLGLFLIALIAVQAQASDCGVEKSFGTPFSDAYRQSFQRCLYLGLGAGVAKLSPELQNDGRGFRVSEEFDPAVQLTLGYRLSYLWFAEASYANLGNAQLSSNAASQQNDPNVDIDYESIVLAAGRYLFNNKNSGWNLFGKAGYAYTRFTPDNEQKFAKGDSSNIMIGGGIEFRPKRSAWLFRGLLDIYEEDVQVAMVSVSRYFNPRGGKTQRNTSNALNDQSASAAVEQLSPVVTETAPAALDNDSAIKNLGVVTSPEQRLRDCEKLDESMPSSLFALDSIELVESSKRILDAYASVMLRNPDLTIEIGAHTNRTGNQTAEIDLTGAQANAVIDYLVSQGVAADQLIARAYGSKRLLANGQINGVNDQARNRRVTLRVMNVGLCF